MLKLDKSIEVNVEHSPNILLILSTFGILKLEIFIEDNDEHP